MLYFSYTVAFADQLAEEGGVSETPAESPRSDEENLPILAFALLLPDDFTALYVGEAVQLTPCIDPADAMIGTLVWTSSDDGIAFVDQTGLVTALAPGEVTVFAAAEYGEPCASIVLTVSAVAKELSPSALQESFPDHGDATPAPSETPDATPAPTETPDATPAPSEGTEVTPGSLETPVVTVIEATASLLREGGSPMNAVSLPTTFSAVTERLRAGLSAMQFDIDVGEYALDPAAFHAIYQTLVNEDLSLFYVGGEYALTLADGIVKSVTPTYTRSAEDAQSEEWRVQAAIRQILSDCITPGMTDMQKALAVADYFCVHFSYAYDSGAGHNYTHLLLEHRGVCQAFSDAYSRVMRAAGISDCVTVNSSAMTHSWNMIRLDGKWYHVDNTWNDRYNSRDDVSPGFAQHRYFLLSDALMLSSDYGHYGVDNHPTEAADSLKYDNYFWNNVDSPICILSDSYYYPQALSDSSWGILCRSATDIDEVTTVLTVDCTRPGRSESVCMGLAQRGGRLYYNTASELRSCLPDGTDDRLETAPALPTGAAISRLYVSGDTLYYGIGRDNYLPDLLGSFRIPVQRPLTSVSLPDAFDVSVGTSGKLTAAIEPANASVRALSYASDAPGILSVDSASGSYQALAVGTATVTATANDGSGLSDVCLVSVLPRLASVAISGPEFVSMTDAAGVQLTATGTDTTGNTRDITYVGVWRSSDPAIATVSGGHVTPLKPGRVTIFCQREGKTGTRALTVAYPVETITVTGGDTLLSGMRLPLRAALLPADLTDVEIEWRIAAEDAAYASIAGSGLTATLTARTVTEAHTVYVTAAAKNGSCVSEAHAVTIVPFVGNVYINRDGVNVTGTVIPIDLNDASLAPLTLNPVLYPNDALQGWKWVNSDTRGVYASYTPNEEGALTISDYTGRAGTVTITATATDGSKKSAVVKIQFMKLAQELHIAAAKTQLCGGERLQLTNNITANRMLTHRNLVWTLNDEALAYASVSSTGLLTTRSVPKELSITVKAMRKDNPVVTDSVTLTLHPAAQQVDLYCGSACWSGTKQPVETGTAAIALRAEILPEGVMEGVTWKSSSTRIATVDENGLVTPLRPGTVTITATAADGSRKAAWVKLVIGTLMQELHVVNAPEANEIHSGRYLQLKAAYANAPTNKALVWGLVNSSDAIYSSVSAAGRVTAKTVYEPHDVAVRVTAGDGGGAQDQYIVRILPSSNTVLNILDENSRIVTKQTLTYGLSCESIQLAARKLGAVEDEPVTWKSSNPACAAVDVASGRVTLLKNGSATITATSADKRTATLALKIVSLAESVTITPVKGYAAVSAGKSLALAANVLPKTATSKAVKWSVSDPGIATISTSGVLTARAALRTLQTVTVTAATKDGGTSGKLTVTVYPLAQSLSITRGDRAIENTVQVIDRYDNPTLALSPLIYPLNANQSVVWSMAGTRGAAYMDSDGTLHLLKDGTVTVTATAKDGSGKRASFRLSVVSRAKTIAVGSRTSSFELYGGGKLTLFPDFGERIPTNKKVTWRLAEADTPYATITAAGVLTAKKVTATRTIVVTVTSVDDSRVSATRSITLRPAVR